MNKYRDKEIFWKGFLYGAATIGIAFLIIYNI